MRSSSSISGSRERSEAQKIGIGRPPAARTCSASVSTNAVFPARWCAR